MRRLRPGQTGMPRATGLIGSGTVDGHAWSTAFGVSTRMGMDTRVSFLIDPAGKVAKVYPNVDPGLHADEVLKDAAALSPAAPAKAVAP